MSEDVIHLAAVRCWRELCPVRVRRQDRDQSMRKLCDGAGISMTALVGTESGKRRPRFATLSKLAKHFGVAANQLFWELDRWWADKPTPETAGAWLERIMKQ